MDVSYGCGDGKYSDKGIDLRSSPYFQSLRRIEDNMYSGGRSLYDTNGRKDYEANSYY